MDFIKEFGTLPFIIFILVAFNMLMGFVYFILGQIKDKTVGTGDNKAYEWIGKIVGFVQGVIDFVQGNTKHK